MRTSDTALTVRGLGKHFGGVTALDGVDLTVRRAEAVAVIGPNGAGKSTLLKLIAGVHRRDSGSIHLGERRLDRLPPHRITRLGVALAHQVPRPFHGLTVRDNVRIGAMAAGPPMRGPELDELLALCRLDTKAARPADSLRVLDLKRLEVARALATRPQVLMLDEVAAGLVGRELDEAIDLIRRVHQRGTTVILVEHIERVVRELVDRVLVLNWGRPIAEGTPAQIALDEQVRAVYLGDSSPAGTGPAVHSPDVSQDMRSAGQDTASTAVPADTDDVLVLDGVTSGYGDMLALRDFSLRVRPGQIVTVLGANGAGKSTLCGTLMGTVGTRTGRITAFGRDITRLPVHERARLGIAYCQEGRRVFGDLTVAENLQLGAPLSLAKGELHTRMDRVHAVFPVLAERAGQKAGTMSGGQQQMLAVGRALMANPSVLICDEISLGLAPVAIDALYQALTEINAQGVAILLVEQNVKRALGICDHAVVLSRGRVSYRGGPAGLLDEADLDAAYFGTPTPDAAVSSTTPATHPGSPARTTGDPS
ncbi:ATP-binding cassette domain-containing protein [Streptomyces fuscichromogenes]|uniref:Branched-chain amino acid ABC transporter ATP-binding protein n=1 Tax=Streptomyces fuscichromogenes TaxID=1324013 RepID=A0A917XGR1_9ACTN|nr:ATP-binding cassette domain-containing protein [Streptomyces fuscichromogenes]GGN22864.1 branched-chain amino acid ABC transporter ATP-binding protein [Streptomyces fuscichromogenes]